jgi:hypothetical protein
LMIGAVAARSGRCRQSGVGAIGQCRRGVRARHDDDGSKTVWEATTGGEQPMRRCILKA